MEYILVEKLRSYIMANNLDLLLQLQHSYGLTKYLEDKVALVTPQMNQWISEGKPQYVVEELCMNELTADLKPSKFNYIKELLEAEFPQQYRRFAEMGVLTYEVVNMIERCTPVFDELGFREDNAEERTLRQAIIGAIGEYLGM